jgi:GNAT superfamily N-acetyltransferase
MTIRNVEDEAELEAVKALFEEYWTAFGFTPCFQGFSAEVAALPGKYAPPRGRLALARVGGEVAGCGALREVDGERCEMKRVYVRPAFRGTGMGRAIVEWLMAEARSLGYREMVADTMPVMARALAMYEQMGFERTGPYGEAPTAGAIYIRRKLCR